MNLIKKIGVVFAAFSVPAVAHANDLGFLTDSIDFTPVGTAVLAVAAALAGIYVTWKAAGMILRAIRGL